MERLPGSRWIGLALWLAVASGVFAEGPATEPWWQPGAVADGGAASVLRSPADDRQYRYLRLANGLQVVLVSDPDADKGAAALSVAVGSFDNPAARPGLAHFLEHMLFLGTEKYPESGEYQAFISDHGGSHNAYTSLERTTYFFDIDAPHLEAALDRFAQFFIAPRFDPQYVERERQAVEAEYRLKLRDDARRQGDVMAEVVNPDHPLAKFSVGSVETLADREQQSVRADLLEFYRDHYSADRMTLAITGTPSLDALERMVAVRFNAIPKRAPPATVGEVPLLADGGPKLVRMTPDRERRELGLLFELPPQAPQWQTKPAFFVAHLLGDEGEHSLLAELKRRGWAEQLNAGLAYDSTRGAAFALTIGLTPVGLTEREAVLDLAWQWIATARADGVEAWRYRELAVMQQAEFRFLQQSGASEQVVGIAEGLHDYPPAEVLRGPYLLQEFQQDAIASVLDRLRPEHALILVTAPELGELPRRSRHYDAPYAVDPVPPAHVAGWRQPAQSAAELQLPGPNPYLPDSFSVSERGGPAIAPQLLVRNEQMQLWHYADRRYGTPRAVFSAQLLAPPARDRRGAALSALYLALVRDQLAAEVYPASLAGLDFDLQRWDGGIVVGLRGYADKQEALLDRVLGALAAPQWDVAAFARVKASLIRGWRNSQKDWPIRQALEELGPLLRELPRPLELAAELEGVDEAELRQFSATLYRDGAAKIYAGGVLDADRARRLATTTVARLGIAGTPAEHFYRTKRLPAAPASPGVLVAVAAEQQDVAALWYLQGGADSLAERARVAVLQQLIEAPFYSTLRTERQLGYVVGSQIMPLHRVPGMVLYAQSPRIGVDRLTAEIENFVATRCTVLEAMNDAELERSKQAVLANLEEQPKNLEEQADRHRESLALDYPEFDFRPRLAAAVREQDAALLADACQRLFGDRRRGLWILAARPESGAVEEAAKPLVTEGEFRYRW